MIRFRTLGALDLVGPDGVRHEPIMRQSRLVAVLCYLAVAPGSVRRRSTVLAMFWPEADERRARHNLNQALYALRQELGDVILSTGPDEIGLDVTRLQCDAIELESAVRNGQPARVIDLYRGEFAEGLSISGAAEFQHWLDSQRMRLRTAARNTLLAAADGKRTASDIDEAVRYAQAALRWSPHDEPIAERLIDLLDSRGDRAGALLTFREFARRLQADLEIEPTPALQDRAEAILVEATAAGEPIHELLAARLDGADSRNTAPRNGQRRVSVPVATTALLTVALVATFWRATSDGSAAAAEYQPAPQAIALFEAGIQSLEGQGLGNARRHFDEAFRIDTMFAAAALESAWAWCRSHLRPGCMASAWPHIDSLIERLSSRRAQLSRAQRNHLDALNSRRWNRTLGEYGALRDAAELDPERYALEFVDAAVSLGGRWQEALDALSRTDRVMFGAANRWYLTQQALHALGRHVESVDSLRVWRGVYPEWQTQFLAMEARALGVLGWTDTLFARFDLRSGMKGGESAALGLLMSATNAMLVHGQPGVRELRDSIVAVFERAVPSTYTLRGLQVYYRAGQYERVHEVLDSVRILQTVPSFEIDVYDALIAARTGDFATAHSIMDRICKPRPAPAPDEAEDIDLLLACTRIAAISGRPSEAHAFLRDAFSRGLDSPRIGLIRADLDAIRDDPLIRRAGF